MRKILLIDGNNLCYRVFWGHRSLTHNGASVSLLYGVFKNLASLKEKYHDHHFVIVWDSKSQRRVAESTRAVQQGLIPSSYKENRRTDTERDELFKDMFSQMAKLKQSLNLINIQQIELYGYEADDIIHTLCKRMPEDEIMVVTSDKDYYQILRPGITLFDPLKKTSWTQETFKSEYGIEPQLWVDVGAIAGDNSDNIFGADGWGEITALKYVRQFGELGNILNALEQKTGRTKKEEALLSFKNRLLVAKSLKQMDMVQDLPELQFEKRILDRQPLQKFFLEHGFGSLLLSIGKLVT